MTVDRRQLALGAAVVVVLGWATWTFWPATPAPPRAESPAQVARTARAARKAAADVPEPVAPVRLEALTASRDEPGEGARNPFRFQPKVVPPPPKPPVTVAPPTTPDSTRPPVPAGPPPLPPIPLKFLGFLTREDGKTWAVLSDGKTPTPMFGREGDIIDGRYAIVKIGTESIEMTYADGRGRQVIRLTGQ